MAACFPEQLLWRRDGRSPASRSSLAPRDESGSCGPHARSPSSRPRADSMRSAIATCSGSPPCDAHASASSSSPHWRSSNPPDLSSGITWKGFAQDRQCVKRRGSPAPAERQSCVSTTAAWTRCRDSMTPPRVTTTSMSSDFMPGRYLLPPNEASPSKHNRRLLASSPVSAFGEEDAAKNERATKHRGDRWTLTNTREHRSDDRGAHWFPEKYDVHLIRARVSQRPVLSRVSEHHRTERKQRENRVLPRREWAEVCARDAGDDQERDEAGSVDNRDVRPQVERGSQASANDVV